MKFLLSILLITLSFNIQARPLTKVERLAVEKTIREELKDPESAKFYHMDYPYPGPTSGYCGYVNARNSFGAFTGKQLFYVFVNQSEAISLDISQSTGQPLPQDVLAAACASSGYDIPVQRAFYDDVNSNRMKKNIPSLSESYILN